MKSGVSPSPSSIGLVIFLLSIAVVMFAPQITYAQANSAVPSAWLDSLVANEWRIENDGMFGSYRMKKVETLLKKSGEIQRSDTSFILVQIDENGLQERFLTDEAGDIVEPMPEDSEQKGAKEPLLATHPEYRDFYSYSVESTGVANLVKITCEPKPDNSEGMFTALEVDTTSWMVFSIESIPNPLPPRVKELTMAVSYEPYGEGRARPSRLISHAHASVLFLQVYLTVEMEFFDYRE